MPLLNILQFPDPRLTLTAAPVEDCKAAHSLIDDMFETLYEAQGVGLSATQVNILQRIVVIDVSSKGNEPRCFINPHITAKRGTVELDEGCLSFPGIFAKVKRAKEIDMVFLDKNGKTQQILNASGLLGHCIQHEIDHLNGITFYDHLSSLKQSLVQKKLAKIRRRML